MTTPREVGFWQPAEWAPHDAVWVAFPHLSVEWGEDFEGARVEVVAMCDAIADPDPATGEARGERLEVLVRDAVQEREARDAFGALGARFHRIPFGDIWTRDIAPVFLTNRAGEVACVRFRFNGWGEKYVLDGDAEVAARIAETVGGRCFAFDWVLEGGSVEVDGEGTLLTTRQCLLHPSRNPRHDASTLERGLADAFGVERILWLEEGLANDHTDGHVDTLARFVAPGVVVCMEPADDDPNRDALLRVARDLRRFVDAAGRRLEVVPIPSPGRVLDRQGRPMPASYANFYVANTTVVVPTYGQPSDAAAVEAIGRLFPGRRTVGCSARHILSGGGAFHCITQQQPQGRVQTGDGDGQR